MTQTLALIGSFALVGVLASLAFRTWSRVDTATEILFMALLDAALAAAVAIALWQLGAPW